MSIFRPKFSPFVPLVVVLMLVACGGGGEPDDIPTATMPSQPEPTTTSTIGSPTAVQELIDKPRPTGMIPTAVPPMDSSFDADGDGFMTKDELWDAMVATEAQYPLPPGYVVSLVYLYDRSTAPHPDSAKFENGTEHSIIGRVHWCDWGQTFLDAEVRDDELTKDTALNQLQTVTLNAPTFGNLRDRFEEIFQAASLGDSADLRNLVQVNCTWDGFEATPSANLLPTRTSRGSVL